MEHIIKHHIKNTNTKSRFVEGIDVKWLIRQVRAHPFVKQKHQSKHHRCWYLGKFSQVIGYRGYDGTECRWLAVLMDQNHLITAYPISHPKSLKWFRERHQQGKHQSNQQ